MKTKYGLNVIFHQFMKKSFHIAGCYSHLEDAVIETESSCPSASNINNRPILGKSMNNLIILQV